jgi:hypothetical protein
MQQAKRAQILFDSSVSPAPAGFRGVFGDRHLLFVDDDLEIHLKISSTGPAKELYGQLIHRTEGIASELSAVTLLAAGEPRQKTTTAAFGEFSFQKLPEGSIAIEIFAPQRRVLACFSV